MSHPSTLPISSAESQEVAELVALLESQEETHRAEKSAGPNVAGFILSCLRQSSDLALRLEAEQIVRIESRVLADFTRCSANLSMTDKMLLYQATLSPAFTRMAEWTFSYARRCGNCQQLFLSLDAQQRFCCGWQHKAWLKGVQS